MNLLNTKYGRFKFIAIVEGWSYIILLLIAMPLKYVWGNPWMVQKVGMAHGVLFVLYVLAVVLYRNAFKWTVVQTGLALLLSFIPFGTFFVDRLLLQGREAGNA